MYRSPLSRFYVLAALSLLAAACAHKPMIPAGLKASGSRIAVEEYPGLFKGDVLRFGPYKAFDVKRTLLPTSNATVSAGSMVSGNAQRTNDRYSFRFDLEGAARAVSCHVVAEKRGMSIGFTEVAGNRHFDMDCKVTSLPQDTVAGKLHLRLMPSGKYEGTFETAGMMFEVETIHQEEGGDSRVAPLGFMLRKDGRVIGAVEMQKAAWMAKEQSAEERAAAALASATLLLFKDPLE